MRLPEPIFTGKLIAVARGLSPERAVSLAHALTSGGIEVIEVTMEGAEGAAAIAALRGEAVTVGAGTVMTVSQASKAVDAGASFLVSPHIDADLIAWAEDRRVPYLPGVLTPGEIALAVSHGVTTMKLFPASLGGPDLVRALLGPYPGIELIPTGGVDDTNAAEYVEAGAPALGVGGWLTAHSDLQTVTRRAARLREVV